jgi:YggT family protein
MQQALLFLLDTGFSLLFFVFLLRLLLQWSRANFRNPLASAVLQASNWLVMPLRRLLPAIGKLDTATAVALLAIALARVAALEIVLGVGLPPAWPWFREALLEITRSGLWLYFWAIFIYALLSMIAPGIRSPLQDVLESLCEPLLYRIRAAIPSFAGLDLSPMWAGIIIQMLLILLR